MDLLEYQAKKLFARVGIPVLPSQPIHDPSELKRLQIPYPVVLKSQVSVGGRGKAGGIRFVENTIDAIAAARHIFNLSILGQYPEVLLAEARYNTETEFFLAVVLDYQLQRPVLLGSHTGGIHVEALLKNLQKVVIEDAFSPYYARSLCIKMGVEGKAIESVSQIIQKMYQLFQEGDLDLIEINPLGVNADGELMALDGKIAVNDCAFQRNLDILSLGETITLPDTTAPQLIANPNIKGRIGIIGNRASSAEMLWDLLSQGREKPHCCVTIGADSWGNLLDEAAICQQLKTALDRLLQLAELRVILINVIHNQKIIQAIATSLADYWHDNLSDTSTLKGEERTGRQTSATSRSSRQVEQKTTTRKTKKSQPKQFVIRLIGAEIDELKQTLTASSLHYLDNLEEAIEKTLSLAKSR